MTKPELISFIMERTTEYKKTHPMNKHKADLKVISAEFSVPESAANLEAGTQTPVAQSKPADFIIEGVRNTAVADLQPGYKKWSESATLENAPDNLGEPSDSVNEYLQAPVGRTDEVTLIILAAYEENKKIVKARRMDKDEFIETVVEKTSARVTVEHVTDQKTIKKLTVAVMQELLTDLVAFCPMIHNEKKMLETIPLLSDYQNVESQVNGKGFLQKVKELHNIEINTSRALMVSLKKKKYITIGGGKKTFIILLERGVRYLQKVS